MLVHDGLLQIFNVDHGACALLTMPNKQGTGRHRVLIDCGHAADYQGKPWYPGEHLRNQSITYVDLLICTNYDEDHASGVPSLVEHGVSVGCILGNPTVPPRQARARRSAGPAQHPRVDAALVLEPPGPTGTLRTTCRWWRT